MSARSTDCVHVTVDSAVAAPQATFGGESVFRDVVEVAAAYLFYLCRNHPFLDRHKATTRLRRLVGRQT